MEDATKYNITDERGRLLCPVCGFVGYSATPPYNERMGLAGICICPCCLWEPGFDDHPSASTDAKDTIGESIKYYRERWMDTARWLGKTELRPSNWDAKKQTAKLFAIAPYVRS